MNCNNLEEKIKVRMKKFMSQYPFIPFCLLSDYFVTNIVQQTKYKVVNKTDIVLVFQEDRYFTTKFHTSKLW